VKIDAAAHFEVATTLWRQGEISTSVQMLQELCSRTDLLEQSIQIGRAGMLAQLVSAITVLFESQLLTYGRDMRSQMRALRSQEKSLRTISDQQSSSSTKQHLDQKLERFSTNSRRSVINNFRILVTWKTSNGWRNFEIANWGNCNSLRSSSRKPTTRRRSVNL
jgi:hypothetical protein